MLNRLDEWCIKWGLTINMRKSNIVHFRPTSFPLSDIHFKCGISDIGIVDRYKYLGVILTQHLDLDIMTKIVSRSASRALGLLISKDRAFGGMPFECFTKCFDAIVQSTIDYSSSVWGTKSYSHINAVQHRACRYFLGLGRYAPNVAVNGDMGWPMPEHRQWLCITRKWCRIMNMDVTLLSRNIFSECNSQSNRQCKTWFHRVSIFFAQIGQAHVCQEQQLVKRTVMNSMDIALKVFYDSQWNDRLHAEHANRGREAGGNKLRTYKQFKEQYSTEPYVKIVTQKKYRSAYAKFRCGVAPIKIETGRYGLNRVPVEERLCEYCNVVEDEFHVIMQCSQYDDIRMQLMSTICDRDAQFDSYTIEEQFIQLMSNHIYYKTVSKAMYSILNKRRYIMAR